MVREGQSNPVIKVIMKTCLFFLLRPSTYVWDYNYIDHISPKTLWGHLTLSKEFLKCSQKGSLFIYSFIPFFFFFIKSSCNSSFYIVFFYILCWKRIQRLPFKEWFHADHFHLILSFWMDGDFVIILMLLKVYDNVAMLFWSSYLC